MVSEKSGELPCLCFKIKEPRLYIPSQNLDRVNNLIADQFSQCAIIKFLFIPSPNCLQQNNFGFARVKLYSFT